MSAMQHPIPENLREYAQDGFTIVPGILSKSQAAEMAVLLQHAIDQDLRELKNEPGYIDDWMVHNLMVRGDPFLRLIENPVIHAYLNAAFSDACILYAYTSSSLPPNGSNYSRRIHVDSPRVIPGYATNVGFLVALDDFTLDNGATYILPRSFQRADPPSEEEFLANAVRLTPKTGEGIFFNARCWHMGGHNKTDKPRHAVTMNICRSFMRQRFDYPRLVPPQLVETLGPVGKRFLGFNVRVPASLEEYYGSAAESSHEPSQG